MTIGEALHATEVPDGKRLALSLAGAVLISLAGFALILIGIAELPHLVLTRTGQPTPMVAALLPILRSPIIRVLIPMLPILIVFPTILVAERKRRSSSAHRVHKF